VTWTSSEQELCKCYFINPSYHNSPGWYCRKRNNNFDCHKCWLCSYHHPNAYICVAHLFQLQVPSKWQHAPHGSSTHWNSAVTSILWTSSEQVLLRMLSLTTVLYNPSPAWYNFRKRDINPLTGYERLRGNVTNQNIGQYILHWQKLELLPEQELAQGTVIIWSNSFYRYVELVLSLTAVPLLEPGNEAFTTHHPLQPASLLWKLQMDSYQIPRTPVIANS